MTCIRRPFSLVQRQALRSQQDGDVTTAVGAAAPALEPGVETVLDALGAVSTSNAWSLLHTGHRKLSERLRKPPGLRQLAALLDAAPPSALRQRGIWVQSFGKKFAPIVCVNRRFARALQEDGEERPCQCKQAESSSSAYFTSHAYNGGRHACTASKHQASCPRWEPPSTGHLYSWRRGYDDSGGVRG